MEIDKKKDNTIATIKKSIKTRLSINYDENHNDIVDDLISDYLDIASNNSHRNIDDKMLIPYVKNSVIEAYNRLGVEGFTSSGEGGQNYSYQDIEEKLANDVKSIRVLK